MRNRHVRRRRRRAEEEDCGLWSEQPENHRSWATEEMQRINQASSIFQVKIKY